MPQPRKNERKENFISRCMSDNKMVEEFEDRSQRRAVCESYWENKE